MTQITMPKGEYYIGDPCYVIEEWDEYLETVGFEGGVKEFRGMLTAKWYTKYGDGAYESDYGHTLLVDSGTIGCIPKELCTKDDGGGAFIEFEEDFTCEEIKDGVMQFGHLIVDTRDEDEYD